MNITPYSISKKVKKPPQSVYRKIESILKKPPVDDIHIHIRKDDDKWFIDETGESIILSAFESEQQSTIIQQNVEQNFQQQISTLNNRILELEQQLKTANDELTKERKFSRTQILFLTEKVIEQNEKLIQLNENQQILQAQSQKNVAMLAADTETNKKGNFFARLFGKKQTDNNGN
jgi:hypothetical protein